MNLFSLECDSGMIGFSRLGQQETDETDCMTMEPTKLHGRQRRHLEDLKKQIAHCLDKELDLLAEERKERAERLGLAQVLAQRPHDH
jgi:hypothetical protein